MEVIRRGIRRIAVTPPCRRPSDLTVLELSFIPLLSLVSLVYSGGVRLRRRLYSLGIFATHRLAVPVISVGNVTWGGNGKTPMVEFLARYFSDRGVSALILTRGYGGGDEAKMLLRQLHGTSAKVGVGANRTATASKFLEHYGYISFPTLCEKLSCEEKMFKLCNSGQIGLAILDDGMQHLSLMRDVEIVMVNALMPWGNHQLLPAGPLREPLDAISRADIVVIHHADLVVKKEIAALESKILQFKESIPIFKTKMAPMHFFLPETSVKLPLTVVKNALVLCLSAIGLADSFVRAIEKMGPSYVDRIDFSDHHFFQLKKMKLIRQRLEALEETLGSKPVVIVTEKDYDRSPTMTVECLEPYTVLVLCSRLQFLSDDEKSEDRFKEKVVEHLLLRNKQGVNCKTGITYF